MHRQVFNLRGQEIYSPEHPLHLTSLEGQWVALPSEHPLRKLGAEAIQIDLLDSLDGFFSYLQFKPIKTPLNSKRVYLDGLNLMVEASFNQNFYLDCFFHSPRFIEISIGAYTPFYQALDEDFIDTQGMWGVYLAYFIGNILNFKNN